MAIYTNITGDMQKLRSVLSSSGYFTTVSYDDTDGEIITCNVGTAAMLTITKTYGAGSTIGYSWAIQGVLPVYTNTVAATGTSPNNEPLKAYQCTGGLMLRLGSRTSNTSRPLIITKNQSNVTTVVFGVGTPGSVSYTIGAIAATDDGEYTEITPFKTISNQTIFSPICTCVSLGAASYTPMVKMAVYKQTTTFGYIRYGGNRYLYDGYLTVYDTQNSGV